MLQLSLCSFRVNIIWDSYFGDLITSLTRFSSSTSLRILSPHYHPFPQHYRWAQKWHLIVTLTQKHLVFLSLRLRPGQQTLQELLNSHSESVSLDQRHWLYQGAADSGGSIQPHWAASEVKAKTPAGPQARLRNPALSHFNAWETLRVRASGFRSALPRGGNTPGPFSSWEHPFPPVVIQPDNMLLVQPHIFKNMSIHWSFYVTRIITHLLFYNFFMTYFSISVCPFLILFIGCIKRCARISLYVPLFFLTHHMACRILVPQLGIKSVPLALESQSLNHWTARELTYILPS